MGKTSGYFCGPVKENCQTKRETDYFKKRKNITKWMMGQPEKAEK